MKILVIRFSSMGDVIIATSLFSYLKNVVPASHIHFLTDAHYAGLFKDDPRLESVVGAEKESGFTDCGRILDDGWDLVIDLQSNKRSKRIIKRLSKTTRIGVFNKRHWQRLLLLATRLNTYNADDSVAKRYIEAAGFEKKGSAAAWPLRVVINEDESKRVYGELFNAAAVMPLIALVPFSAWRNKEWGRERFIEVARHFIDRGWHAVIMGGPSDRQDGADLQREIGSHCLATAGRLSLYECACLLKRCSLALGNDTGLSHLARACGVRTGVIFGSTTVHFGFIPFGDPPFEIFQANIFCRPCHPHGGNFCYLGNRQCLRRISPTTVIQGLEKLLAPEVS